MHKVIDIEESDVSVSIRVEEPMFDFVVVNEYKVNLKVTKESPVQSVYIEQIVTQWRDMGNKTMWTDCNVMEPLFELV